MARRAVNREEFSALFHRIRRRGHWISPRRGRLARLLGVIGFAAGTWQTPRRHGEHHLAEHHTLGQEHVVAPAQTHVQGQDGSERADDEKRKDEHVLHHRRTSSAPADLNTVPTASAFSGGQVTATPNRSSVNRGSYVTDGVSFGSRPRMRMANTVDKPPSRIVNSNAMMMNGGKETGALPPVSNDQMSDDQMVRKNPVAVPVKPPINVNRRTFDSGRTRSTSCSISSMGAGVYTVKSAKPFARSSRIASTVVSTCANTPRTFAVAMSVRSSVRVLHGVRQDLLDFDDGQRRHYPDECQE